MNEYMLMPQNHLPCILREVNSSVPCTLAVFQATYISGKRLLLGWT